MNNNNINNFFKLYNKKIFKISCLLSLIIFIFFLLQKPENVSTILLKHGFNDPKLFGEKVCNYYSNNIKLALYYSANSVVNENFSEINTSSLSQKRTEDLTLSKNDYNYYYQVYNPKKYIIVPLDENTIQIKINTNNSNIDNFKKNFFLYFKKLNDGYQIQNKIDCKIDYKLNFTLEFIEQKKNINYIILLISPLMYFAFLAFRNFRYINN